MIKIYYAHCKAIYDTTEELDDVSLLQELGFAVLNPNSPQYKKGWEDQRMRYGLVLLNTCSALAFRRLPDGRVPAGVWQEIKWAEQFNIPIIEIPYWSQYKSMSIEDTREYTRKYKEKNERYKQAYKG